MDHHHTLNMDPTRLLYHPQATGLLHLVMGHLHLAMGHQPLVMLLRLATALLSALMAVLRHIQHPLTCTLGKRAPTTTSLRLEVQPTSRADPQWTSRVDQSPGFRLPASLQSLQQITIQFRRKRVSIIYKYFFNTTLSGSLFSTLS